MAIVDDLDCGRSVLTQGPSSGQESGSQLIVGGSMKSWGRGGKAQVRSMVWNVQAPLGASFAAAYTRAATAFVVQRLVELAHNPNRNPVYIQWSSGDGIITANPWDGYYRLDDVTPLEWKWDRHVPCQVTATLVALGAPNRLAMAYAGGSLPTNYSGVGKNLVALPVGSTAQEASFTRSGAEGAIPCILAPVASPEPFVPPSIAGGNLWKGGVHVYDTINTSAFAVPAGASILTLFRSLGTDATGTLNAWTTLAGSPSIASNIASLASGAQIKAGHADWWDGVFRQRFIWATGNNHVFDFHASDTNNKLSGQVAGAVYKFIAGVSTSLGSHGAVLVNGTAYWAEWTASGTTYTFKMYADSAGAVGAQIGSTVTATVTDAILQTGPIELEGAGSGTCQFGGAFANVCQVTGPAPAGWNNNTQAGEPAYCWSKASPYAGVYSLSIFNAHSSANGQLTGPVANPIVVGTTYTGAGALRTLAGTTGTAQWQGNIFNAGLGYLTSMPLGIGLTGTNPWTVQSGTFLPIGAWANVGMVVSLSGTGTAYFDNGTVQGTTPIFGDCFEPDRHAMWVEVFGTDHNFVGDCVVSNGLLLLLMQAGQSQIAQLYLWNTALAVATWQQVSSSFQSRDSASNSGTLNSYTLTRVGPEECAVSQIQSTGGGKASQVLVRLQRGRYEGRADIRPLTEADTNVLHLFLTTPAVPKIIFNSAKVADVVISEASPVFATDYGYGAGFIASATYPFIAGFLYQNEPVSQPYNGGNVAYLGLGDSNSLALNAQRSYGFFAIPYGVSGSYSTANLQAECETGQLTGGFVSAADAAASAGNAAKLPNTTVSGALDTAISSSPTQTGFTVAAGTFKPWFRVRVGATNANTTAEIQLQIWSSDGVAVQTLNLAPAGNAQGALLTTYQWFFLPDFTPVAGKTYFFRIISLATATTDWFIDEAVLAPKTLTADNRGPQDLWQQFINDLSCRQVRG